MTAKITVIIEEDCDDDGNGGTVVAKPIAIIPDQTWSDTKDAWADATGWTETVIDDDGNEIPNPVSKAWNVPFGWRQRSALLLRAYLRRQNVTPVEQAIAVGVEEADAAITVIDGTAE